jgi:Zn-dependent peptidase ImmA (M78 family)
LQTPFRTKNPAFEQLNESALHTIRLSLPLRPCSATVAINPLHETALHPLEEVKEMPIRTHFVRKMAQKVLKESKITAPPVDLLTILQAHGIQYEEVDDFPDTVDAMIIERGRETYAAVNGRQHLHRRRFSLAHELGHFFLHRGDYGSEAIVTIDDPPSEKDLVPTKDPAESEADMFAGELLVPLAMLKPHARKGVTELSRIFLVSEQVISVAISKHYNVLFK